MDINDLQKALERAANEGANEAGHQAILAGAQHASGPLAVMSDEHVSVDVNGELSGEVSATSTALSGPYLPSPEGTAGVMAQAAADAGVEQVFG